jgi:hypothetical protein
MGPKDVALLTGQSVPTARKQLMEIQIMLKDKNTIRLSRNLVPTHEVIKYLNINLEALEKNGTLDKKIKTKETN